MGCFLSKIGFKEAIGDALSLLILSFSVFSKYLQSTERKQCQGTVKVVTQQHNARCQVTISSRLAHGEHINTKMAQGAKQDSQV